MAMVAPIVSFGGLWGVPYLTQTYGMSREEAAVITSLSFIGWGIGAPLLGSLSDRLGRRRVPMAIGSGLSAVTLALIPLVGGSPVLLGLLMAVSGFFGSTMVIGIALARESNPPQVSGTVLGFTNTFVVGSGGLFQPLIGYLLDLQWDGAMRSGARVYTAEAYHWGLVGAAGDPGDRLPGGAAVARRRQGQGMRTRVKICCIETEAMARQAIAAGASALGLVTAMPSGPGVISDAMARRIAGLAPPGVATFLLTCETDPAGLVAQVEPPPAPTWCRSSTRWRPRPMPRCARPCRP